MPFEAFSILVFLLHTSPDFIEHDYTLFGTFDSIGSYNNFMLKMLLLDFKLAETVKIGVLPL